MAQAAYKSNRFTYAGYCTWPDEERWELIDGEAYAMSPTPTRAHQEVVVALAAQLYSALQETACLVYTAPFDVRLPHREEADEVVDTVVQPDIAVICDPSKLDDQGCRGAPDWIIEVLSPTTAAKDYIRKRELYERHGIREYWLVHPTDRALFVYRLGAAGYGKPRVLPTVGPCASAVIPDLTIDWDGIFTPVEKAG